MNIKGDFSSLSTERAFAISVKDLSKTYRNGVQALAGVSFNVRPGETFLDPTRNG